VCVCVYYTRISHLQQLNDSTFIVSLLRSYIADPVHEFDELITYYPHHKVENRQDPKKEVIECVNKYFVMFHDSVKTTMQIEDKKYVLCVFIQSLCRVYQ
jgi:hypothetical protein